MSEFTKAIQDKLTEPFTTEIKWLPRITTKKGPNGQKVPIERNGQRVAGCMAHIDARDVMNRLDDVVGAGNWSDEYQASAIGKGVECRLTVLGVSKVDVGIPSDTEPEKGAYSDALKRAAVKFGIGRHLYDIDTQWLPFDGYRVLTTPQQVRQAPVSNGAQPAQKPTSGPLPDDETVVMETSAAEFFTTVTALVPRFSHEKHTKAAAKKLGVTAIPGKPDDRRLLYLRLKEYARARDAEESAPVDELTGELLTD